MQDVKNNIKQILEVHHHNLRKKCRDLLETLLVNEDKIALFPRPNQITDHIKIIKDKLKIINFLTMSR
jgi:hypothetical protein